MQVVTPLTEQEELQLKIVSIGKLPNDRELEARMRKAAEGKVKENGIVRRPDDKYRP